MLCGVVVLLNEAVIRLQQETDGKKGNVALKGQCGFFLMRD